MAAQLPGRPSCKRVWSAGRHRVNYKPAAGVAESGQFAEAAAGQLQRRVSQRRERA